MPIDFLMTQIIDLESIVNDDDADDGLVEDMLAALDALGFAPFVVPVYPVVDGEFMCADHPLVLALVHAVELMAAQNSCHDRIVVRVCDNKAQADLMSDYLSDGDDEDE